MNEIKGRETLTDLDRRGVLRGAGLVGGALALLGGTGVAQAAAAGPFPACWPPMRASRPVPLPR